MLVFASSHPLCLNHSREETCSLDRLPETCIPPGRTGRGEGEGEGKPLPRGMLHGDPLNQLAVPCRGRRGPADGKASKPPIARPEKARRAGARWLFAASTQKTGLRRSWIPRGIVDTGQPDLVWKRVRLLCAIVLCLAIFDGRAFNQETKKRKKTHHQARLMTCKMGMSSSPAPAQERQTAFLRPDAEIFVCFVRHGCRHADHGSIWAWFPML